MAPARAGGDSSGEEAPAARSGERRRPHALPGAASGEATTTRLAALPGARPRPVLTEPQRLGSGARREGAPWRESRIAVDIRPEVRKGARRVVFDGPPRRLEFWVDGSDVNESERTMRVTVLEDRGDELLVRFPREPLQGPGSLWLPSEKVIGWDRRACGAPGAARMGRKDPA